MTLFSPPWPNPCLQAIPLKNGGVQGDQEMDGTHRQPTAIPALLESPKMVVLIRKSLENHREIHCKWRCPASFIHRIVPCQY